VNDKITGMVTVRLYKGHLEAVAVETPNTVFDEKLATFMADGNLFNQNSSAGFIEHYSLQMKLAQTRQRTVLLSVGTRAHKLKLLPEMKQLNDMGYRMYATYKTYKFLKSHDIEAILVNKISTPELKPNLRDLLDARRFDLIINIPTHDAKEVTDKEQGDGQVIREMAVRTNTPLVTSVPVAKDMIAKITRARVR
jgi:vacuolar-type H+-ATPase subunit F/Vma7